MALWGGWKMHKWKKVTVTMWGSSSRRPFFWKWLYSWLWVASA